MIKVLVPGFFKQFLRGEFSLSWQYFKNSLFECFPAICLSYAILASPVDRGWMILCFSQTELFSLGVVPVSALNGKIIKAKSLFMLKSGSKPVKQPF